MKQVGLISTGVLLLLLGTVAPTYAQERQEQEAQSPKQEQQAKPEKQQAKGQQKQEKQQQQQAKGQQKQEKQQQQQAKGQQKQEKQQQQQAKGQQKQEKEQQQQAKGQQKQEKEQQQQAKGSRSRKRNSSSRPRVNRSRKSNSSSRPRVSRNRKGNSSSRPGVSRSSRVSARLDLHNGPSAHRRRRPDNEQSRHCDSVPEAKVAYLTIASVRILGAGIDSASAVRGWSTDILASSTAAFGSDSLTHGRKVGTTPTTFTLITLMADITCTTRIIPAFALAFAS